MKTYTITVNGNVYDVTVEEGTGSPAAAPVQLRKQLRRQLRKHRQQLRQQQAQAP